MSNLRVLCSRYLRDRIVSSGYTTNLTRVASHVRRLDAASINQYLQQRSTVIAPVTLATERAMLVGLWRWAYETGAVERPPRGIVKVRVTRKPTRAWTIEQCCTAVKGTFALTTRLRGKGVTLGQFLRCWVLLGYETGARMGDLFRLSRENFEGDTCRWTQGKTGDPVVKVLTPACVSAVQELLAQSPDGRVLGWVMLKSSAQRAMRRYLRLLRLPGSSKWLRRSGCTHVEMANPGKGRLHLGHRTVGLAERSYIDWSQVRRDIPSPPALLLE
jgi:integrase